MNDWEFTHHETVIAESGGRFGVICSCGWSAGRTFAEAFSATMAWVLEHAEVSDD